MANTLRPNPGAEDLPFDDELHAHLGAVFYQIRCASLPLRLGCTHPLRFMCIDLHGVTAHFASQRGACSFVLAVVACKPHSERRTSSGCGFLQDVFCSRLSLLTGNLASLFKDESRSFERTLREDILVEHDSNARGALMV